MLKRTFHADGIASRANKLIVTLVPEFMVKNLPLGRTAALVTEVAVKDLPLGRTLMIYT